MARAARPHKARTIVKCMIGAVIRDLLMLQLLEVTFGMEASWEEIV